MSTGNLNLDLLVKLLGQTTNDNDNIALMAIRKSNEQLAKNGWTWESLLRGKITIVADPFAERQGATFSRPTAPPPMAARPAPMPPAQPAPAYQPQPTYPRPHQPHPKPTPQPSPQTGFQARRPNRFEANCTVCLRKVPSGSGYLDGKDRSGQFRVVCGDNFGHNAKYAKREPRPQATVDNLKDLI